jgi:tetratricopeptide (TPR) repeat protein
MEERVRPYLNWLVMIVCLAVLAPPLAAQPAPAPDLGEAAYQEGRRLYDLREWDRAIAKFKEAYELRHDAASLFNIAQAYRLKGDCVEALGFYKTYSRNFPTAQNLEKVQKFIADLEPCASQQSKAVKAEPVAPAEPAAVKPMPSPPPPETHRTLALSLVAGGGAAVLSSVVVGALARSKWHDALSHCDAMHACDDLGLALGDEARTRATIATGVGAVGLAAVAVGVVILVTAPSEHAGIAVAPIAAPDRAGVAVMGRF